MTRNKKASVCVCVCVCVCVREREKERERERNQFGTTGFQSRQRNLEVSTLS